jgi:hypothetical protein
MRGRESREGWFAFGVLRRRFDVKRHEPRLPLGS